MHNYYEKKKVMITIKIYCLHGYMMGQCIISIIILLYQMPPAILMQNWEVSKQPQVTAAPPPRLYIPLTLIMIHMQVQSVYCTFVRRYRNSSLNWSLLTYLTVLATSQWGSEHGLWCMFVQLDADAVAGWNYYLDGIIIRLLSLVDTTYCNQDQTA